MDQSFSKSPRCMALFNLVVSVIGSSVKSYRSMRGASLVIITTIIVF